MSKALKKLIDINRLREFKNKLVGAGSAYVQTAAVDQTIAGTKTFSKPIVGSVTGSSGSCTGNAASATKLQTARTINGTSFNGSANITTANWGTARNITITDGTNTSTAVSVNGSANVALKLPATIKANLTGNAATATTATTAEACTGNAATATKATQDSDGNKITTTYSKNGHTHDDRYYTENEVNNLLNGKANTSGTYSNLTVGNAGSATNATYANWLRTSSHSDHLFHTEWDGRGYFWTYVTAGDGGYRAVRVARSDSATDADHATKADSAATASSVPWSGVTGKPSSYTPAAHTHDDRYYTESEVNNLLGGKANDNAVVHKSGNESIAGTKTFNDSVHANGFHSTTANALMAQRGEYTLVLRNDGANTYLLMSDKGGVPGTWSDARPLVISNSTGVCDINGNAATATRAASADSATNAGHATKADSATNADHATKADSATSAIILKSNSSDYHEIRFDWSRQIDGRVGLRVDVVDMGGIVTTDRLVSDIRAQWYAAYPDGAEAHNAMWGGRDITAAFNNGTVSANIKNGTFRDIFPGDYITKQVTIPRAFADDGVTVIFDGGTYTVNWVVVDCDYWINKGDTAMTTHHVAIVPQAPIFDARMHSTNTTTGGYAGSDMYRKIIPACARGIVHAFGSSHILTFRDGISNSADISYVSSGITQYAGAPCWWGEWVSVYCNLMSEKMVYGAPVCSAGAMDNTMATRQMSAFRLSEKLINYNRQTWWLRDVVSSAHFAHVDGKGHTYAGFASDVRGVRPFALLV